MRKHTSSDNEAELLKPLYMGGGLVVRKGQLQSGYISTKELAEIGHEWL